MEPRPVAGGTVDVCERCGAAFFGYFDGEPSALARALPPMTTREPVFEEPPRCPDCDLAFELRPWLHDGGPDVLRCEGCMAIFATPAALEALARYTAPGDEDGLRAWVRALFRR